MFLNVSTDPLITSMEHEDTQVYCDGYDAYQEEPTHPGVYYTLKQRSDGTPRRGNHWWQHEVLSWASVSHI